MKYFKLTLLPVLFTIVALVINLNCSDSTPVESNETPPSIKILFPANNAVLTHQIEIKVDAQDSDGITKVDFYIDGSILFVDSTAPYTFNWNTEIYPDSSNHTIFVKMFDLNNNTTGSEVISVMVLDQSPPTVVSTNPVNGDTNVATDKIISITFSEDIDTNTINNSNITIYFGNAIRIPGTLSANKNVVSFEPNNLFNNNLEVHCIVETGVKDLSGLNLVNNYSFFFKTVLDTDQPLIITTTPTVGATDVPIDQVFSVKFSETINLASLTNQNYYISDSVEGLISYYGDSITFSPYQVLFYNHEYQMILTDGIKDTSGNSLSNPQAINFKTISDQIPPVIINSIPTDNEQQVNVNSAIEILFSETISPDSVGNSVILVNDQVIGSVVVDSNRILLTPSVPFDYNTDYNISVQNSFVYDTVGNNLQNSYNFSFKTESNNDTLTAILNYPFDSSIIADTVTINIAVSDPDSVVKVEYFVDNLHILSADDFTSPFQYLWTIPNSQIGSVNSIKALVIKSNSDSLYTNQINCFYLWQLVKTDGNDGFNPLEVPNDLRKMFVRSTDSTLELRYEYAANWVYPYSTDTSVCKKTYVCGLDTAIVSCADTAVDLGIYFDTDLDVSTGRRDAAGDTLNDIGAEYRIILGLHGGNDAFSVWNSSSSQWNVIYDTTGFINHNIPQNTNIMEIGLKWEDIGSPTAINVVNVNVFFRNFCDPSDFLNDFMPDRSTNDHVRINRENRYIGPQSIPNFRKMHNSNSLSSPVQSQYLNPFE